MAIQFARVDIVSRKAGGSAVGLSTYISRSTREAFGTGRSYSFVRSQEDVVFHEVMLPTRAPSSYNDGSVLWNAAEAAEKRKDSQLAKHMVLALPKEITPLEREELTRTFVRHHFTSKDVAVEVAIHKPHKGEENWHAHLLISTRYLGEEGFIRKATELNPSFAKTKTGKAFISEQDHWGDQWTLFQNAFFEEKGLDLRVDALSVVPGIHMKTSRFIENSDKVEENRLRVEEAQEIVLTSPEEVLDRLTYHRAYFSERDVDKYLFKSELEGVAFQETKSRILGQSLCLYDRGSGEETGYYTTSKVRQSEQSVVNAARILSERNHHCLSYEKVHSVLTSYPLKEEQKVAFERAALGSDLVLWRGVAGAGKSYAMGVLRQAYEEEGYKVVGIAPTNTVARDMHKDGFDVSFTLHSFLNRLERGIESLTSSHILMVDEAAMVSTSILERLMKRACDQGAKIVLIGDDRQLISIEKGGMFEVLRQEHGACELREVRRQGEDWAKSASLAFADKNFKQGLKAYNERGYIHWSDDSDKAHDVLTRDWEASFDQNSDKLRFVYAQTNKDVNALNLRLRDIHREKRNLEKRHEEGFRERDEGRIQEELIEENFFETVRGRLAIASGDRLQFYENDYKQKVFNGMCGTVTRVLGKVIEARLDTGQMALIDGDRYQGFGYGYAGTVYRGQGKTQVETYYLHTPLGDARTSYVALTRHKQACHVYVAQDMTPDMKALEHQMSRYVDRGASLKFATRDEIEDVFKDRNRARDKNNLEEFTKRDLKSENVKWEDQKENIRFQVQKLDRANSRDNQEEKEPLKERSGVPRYSLRELKEQLQALGPLKIEDDLELPKSTEALSQLKESERRREFERVASSPHIQEALKKLTASREVKEQAIDAFKAADLHLQAFEEKLEGFKRRGEVILPSEEKTLSKRQEAYKQAFSAYVKEKPEAGGEEASRIIEAYEGYHKDYRSSHSYDEFTFELRGVRVHIAKAVLEEAIGALKKEHGWEIFKLKDPQKAQRWQEQLKLIQQHQHQYSYGFSMEL